MRWSVEATERGSARRSRHVFLTCSEGRDTRLRRMEWFEGEDDLYDHAGSRIDIVTSQHSQCLLAGLMSSFGRHFMI